MNLPSQFIKKVHQVFGEDGRKWLPELPGIVAKCRDKWALSEGVMSENLNMNYVEFTATNAGEPVVLKVGVPHKELFTEMEALRVYKGKGAVRLLDADHGLGAILMRQLKPGTMLYKLGDNRKETGIAANIVRELPIQVPAKHNFPTFKQWVERAFNLTRTEWDPQEFMPRELINKAEVAFEEITRNEIENVVLHGDLHHENILYDHQTGWAAIDPKGVIGPHCLEVGRFLHNQLPATLPLGRREELLRVRIEIFSGELGYPTEIIAACGFVDCVLTRCWSIEDNGIDADWHNGIELAWLMSKKL